MRRYLLHLLRRVVRVALIALLVVLIYAAARLIFLQPRLDRDWIDQHRIPAAVRFDGDLVHVDNVRHFVYRTGDDYDPGYHNRTYDLGLLESAWFVLSPFRENWRGPAHGFISFGFADSQYVAISVEARKEVGEDYSIWKGLVNTYELFYVIGDERDLIGLRAVHWHDDVHVYPIAVSQDRIRDLFVSMLQRAQQLVESPEFYNTAWSNCTTNLYDHAHRLSPETWSYNWRLQLPGYADEMVFDMGLIDTELPLDQAREQFKVNDLAARFLEDPAFSLLIRRR